MTSPRGDGRMALVWDLWIRSFHWGLVLLTGLAWWTFKADLMGWHRRIGYGIAALLAFRVYWGFVGAAPARFSTFVRSPAEVGRYIRKGIGDRVGHNPAGGWSVLALMVALSALIVSGLLGVTQEGDSGRIASALPFVWSRTATHLHALAFDALLALVGLHLMAVLVHQFLGHDLIRAMLSGRKRLPPDVESPTIAPVWSGLIGLALALVAYVALAVLDGD